MTPSLTNNTNAMGSEIKQGSKQNGDYYNNGSTEKAENSATIMKRLEPRRKLTTNSDRLVVTLVGLPARGKSFVARKLSSFFEWNGIPCKIFNVGRYRRQAAAESQLSNGQCDANFFDAGNAQAAAIRQHAAALAVEDMLSWLDNEDSGNESDDSSKGDQGSHSTNYRNRKSRIAIFDATNSTVQRRQWLLEECTSPAKRPGKPTGMVFVESICDDEELLLENFRFKIKNSPDYSGMTEDEAIADLRQRVVKYEEQYETIADDSQSYIKIFNLSTKVLVNHIYGRMSKLIVPALIAWNIGTRPIYLCRPGKTRPIIPMENEDDSHSQSSSSQAVLSPRRSRLLRGNSLGLVGKDFSHALYKFLENEARAFAKKRSSTMDMAHTGTSMTGLAPARYGDMGDERNPVPLQVFTSTMPRALETVWWATQSEDYRVEELSNLNPLDKGDFVGKELEDIEMFDEDWYKQLCKDPFSTRFPGGESYSDLIGRLESVVVDFEQQVIPTLIVSHVSILQVLMAYFRNSPVDKAMEIEVPLHTVIQFTPVRGGGWSETQHTLIQNDGDFCDESETSSISMDADGYTPASPKPQPIWGDHSSNRLVGKVDLPTTA